MKWQIWLMLISVSVGGAALWYGLYRLCRASRIRQAKRRGTTADIAPLRTAFLVTGIIPQVWFWIFILLIKDFHGMS
ncbi:MAG: hypothetical protein IK130_06515 [Oscillospiraceae bacterium]|nr:hypothetical protein [Oscillospiraceae bacterium]